MIPAFSVIKVIVIFFKRMFFVYVLNDLLFANQNDPKARQYNTLSAGKEEKNLFFLRTEWDPLCDFFCDAS